MKRGEAAARRSVAVFLEPQNGPVPMSRIAAIADSAAMDFAGRRSMLSDDPDWYVRLLPDNWEAGRIEMGVWDESVPCAVRLD